MPITLVPVLKQEDIPAAYRDTPVGKLLEYHNLEKPLEPCVSAQMLVGMCMDNRKYLHIPDNFAFIIRSGGANLRYSEFKISFAVAVGGVRMMALIGHSQCGMVKLSARKQDFVEGLVRHGGWKKAAAERHFEDQSPLFEIDNAEEFIVSESERLGKRYPGVSIVPMFYKVEDNRLYLLEKK